MKIDTICLSKSTQPDKKYMVIVNGRTIHFGASGYSDYTKHRDPERKQRYINRHKNRENWTKTGIQTAGFWSLWILWNKETLAASIADTERRFNVKIRRC